MKLLGKSKVMKHKVKPEITYPLVRFPQSEISLAGETAHIFKTEYFGHRLRNSLARKLSILYQKPILNFGQFT